MLAVASQDNTGRSTRVGRVDKPAFTCKFCHKSFTNETYYLKHYCKEMKRHDEFQSPTGQAALGYYQRWMRVKKRNPPAASAFLTSKYFRTFMNFAQFVAKVSLPLPDKFIWLMNEKDYPPTMWTNDDAYTQYLEFLDRRADPMEQVSLSIKTLLNLADAYDVDIADVFDAIRPQELIHMVRLRQLSPWLLLHSIKFKLFFRDKMTDEQKIILETLINPEYWSEQFENKEADVEKIKVYVEEMNI